MDNVSHITSNRHTSATITNDNTLWLWGQNFGGLLGNGTRINSDIPFAALNNVATVAIGGSHVLAVTHDGALWAWGANGNGQLGNVTSNWGETPNRFLEPVRIMGGIALP